MSVCNKQAEENTKANIASIAVTSIVYGIVSNDLSSSFLKKTFWELAKYTWNNDKQARNDFITTALCKLGL